jgi:hypothetical protein
VIRFPKSVPVAIMAVGAFAMAAAAVATAQAPAWAGQAPAAPRLHTAAPPVRMVVKTVRLPAGTTVARIGMGTVRATVIKSGDDAITCALVVQTPRHNRSGLGGGVVTVFGSLSCSAVVSELSITVALYHDDALVTQNSSTNYGIQAVDATAAVGCGDDGDYEGGATGYIQYPTGYDPPSSDFGGAEVFGPTAVIICG